MPTYEFRYTNDAGATKVVERRFSMKDAPKVIEVEDADGHKYIAGRIMSIPARMKDNWSRWDEPGDLPPVDSPIIP